MATFKHMQFADVIKVEFDEYDSYHVRLSFDLGLGNNFTYDHFVNAIFDLMAPNNHPELFIEWTRNLDLDSELIIEDSFSHINTNASDFNDHTRSLWSDYCKRVYG